MSGKRIVLIDLMQGLAMILVILGHHLFPFLPAWYKSMHYYIYLFHMPFFIFISAFLIRYSFKEIDGINGYWKYIRRKAVKFIPPYIIIGLLCILLKRPESLDSFLTQTGSLLIKPLESEATFLWYIYLLFIFYIVSPLVFALPQYCKHLLLAICIILWLYPANTNILCLAYLCKLSPFYMTGVLVAESLDYISNPNHPTISHSHRYLGIGVTSLILFILLSILHFQVGYHNVLEHIIPWVAIPALTYLAWLLGRSAFIRSALVFISINCFGIYLLHLFFVQALALAAGRLSIVGTTIGALIYLTVSISVSIPLAALCWQRINKLIKP